MKDGLGMKKTIEYFQKNEKIIFQALLVLVFLAGVFLRTYHHRQWLHFQLDQSRDATIVSRAVQGGPGKLPLLGPQARSSDLKLGPVFYYFQYIGAKIFGDRPEVMAWPDLFFSVLTLPLFYFFIKKYFSKWLSLGLTAILATSIFAVFYSRFAWNPNSIPFFLLLMAYGLVNATDPKSNQPQNWLYLSFFSLAVVTQLHFVTFFLAPFVFVSFLLFCRPKIKIKHYLAGLLIVGFVYWPVIYSDIKNNGQNARAFGEAFTEKTEEQDAGHNLLEKAFRVAQQSSRFYGAIMYSDQNTDLVSTKNKKNGLKLVCDDECKKYSVHLLGATLFFLLSLVVFVLEVRQKFFSKNRERFLGLNFIWLGSFLLLLIPIAYQISPRFFLVGEIPFLVMLGTLADFSMMKIPSSKFKGLVFFLFASAVFINIKATVVYFGIESKTGVDKNVSSHRDIIEPGGEKVTLEQLQAIADLIKSDWQKNPNQKLYVTADNYYARSIFYLLKYQMQVPTDCYVKASAYRTDFGEMTYYVAGTKSESPFKEGTLEKNNLRMEKEQGTLTVYKLEPKNPRTDQKNPDYCNSF